MLYRRLEVFNLNGIRKYVELHLNQPEQIALTMQHVRIKFK